jgi:long-chain acyl-CoA synthetase
MVTQKNLMAAIFNQFSELCPFPDDVLFTLPPVYHLAGLLTYLVHFYKGCTHITIKRFESQSVLEWTEREKPTAIHLVPAMQNIIVNYPDVEKYDLSSIRVLFYGASTMPVAQLKKSMKLFKCDFYQIAGLTEVTGHLTALRPEDHVIDGPPQQIRRLGSAGREGLGLETRIVDENGNECPPDVPGEEIVRGDSVMAGYWKMPEETRQAIKDGWLYTGDICAKDEDGYIYYVDRSKDMINRGGENVYPREVEEVLCAHPKVFEAAVIGVPDELLGEEVKAVIVSNNGDNITEDEIIDYCRKNLAGFKKPRSVDFVKELPKNPTGKILKRVLREPYMNPPS